MTDDIRRKRTEITIERRRTIVIRGRQLSMVEWCASCGREETKLTAEGAATFCGVSPRTIYRAIEAGSLHFDEATDGLLWLCLTSLTQLRTRSLE